MPVHSQPLATATAIMEEQEARWNQAWTDYQESFFERLRHQVSDSDMHYLDVDLDDALDCESLMQDSDVDLSDSDLDI